MLLVVVVPSGVKLRKFAISNQQSFITVIIVTSVVCCLLSLYLLFSVFCLL